MIERFSGILRNIVNVFSKKSVSIHSFTNNVKNAHFVN